MKKTITGKNTAIDCSLVIRAYNEEKHIGRLLSGIAQQTLKNIEIILVDSGSTDNTTLIASQGNARIFHISPDDFTFGKSLNYGISHASSEFVVIASAHIYPVYPDWLEHLLTSLNNPLVALAYGKQRGNAINNYAEKQIFQRWYPDQSQFKQTQPFCNNANAAIRRSLWEKHAFDESLSGLEDIAWANWAITNKYVLAYVAEAEVIHTHQETPIAVYNRYRREAMAFKRIFPGENFNLLDFFRLTLTNISSDFWHATQQKSLFANFEKILWFRLMQFWGTYQGYHQSGSLTAHLRRTFYYPYSTTPHSPVTQRVVEPIQYNDSQ